MPDQMNRVEGKGREWGMGSSLGEGSYSPLQLHFLRRLHRLLTLRSEQAVQLNQGGVHLIDRAIYSTYCDGVELGVSDEAQMLLHRFAVPAASRASEN
jgi:hypothetical protein